MTTTILEAGLEDEIQLPVRIFNVTIHLFIYLLKTYKNGSS
jgi:hypothetical protein